MKYEDALNYKSQLPDQIDYEGLKMKVVIAPLIEEDFMRFVNEYPVIKYNDKLALGFSTNQQFRVCALWSDGANVIHKGNLSELLDSSEGE